MFEAVGHAVSRLIRIRYGAMVLPRGLKRGAWMELDDADIRALVQAAGGRAQKESSTWRKCPRGKFTIRGNVARDRVRTGRAAWCEHRVSVMFPTTSQVDFNPD
jgi:23S rRNA pseudouridine2605 synthase